MKSEKITIVDYGLGNLGSISNMLNYLGVDNEISSDSKKISIAEKIILPGVGKFDKAMQNINEKGLFEVLNKKALVDKTPILGICLGAQIMCYSSEEGEEKGFGWFKTTCKKFSLQKPFKVPHMGWNKVQLHKAKKIHTTELKDPKFYFVHSYFMNLEEEDEILMTCEYSHKFAAALSKDNLYAVQFHPEKSHKYGLNILKQFSEL